MQVLCIRSDKTVRDDLSLEPVKHKIKIISPVRKKGGQVFILSISPDNVPFFHKKKKKRRFFLFLHENICYGYSLEVPWWDNIFFCGEISKILCGR